MAFFIAGDPTIGVGYELHRDRRLHHRRHAADGRARLDPRGGPGSLILTVVAAALVFFGVPINWTTFATGAVILLAVASTRSCAALAADEPALRVRSPDR